MKRRAEMCVRWLGQTVHQSWLVVCMCIGMVLGVIVGLVMRVNYFVSPVWIGCAVVMLAVAYVKPRLALVAIGLVAGMVIAFVRISVELVGQDYVRGLYGYEVVVSGAVEGDPETDEGATKFRLGELKFGEEGVESSGKLYVQVGRNEALAREDKVILEGKLVEGFGTYAGYMYKPKVVRWERPEPGSWVLAMRNWFAERIERLIPEPQVRLGLSYLLGMKTGLSEELSEQLRAVGLVHIVVASGAHLAILVEVARRIFGRASRMVGLGASVIFVVVFMAMVGWTPSILRAGIMTILTLVAWYVGRKLAPWRIILIVGAVTLMINPMFVMDLGWLLSFASYIGIMVLGLRFARFFYGGRKPGFVASLVLTTMAATVMTLPIVLYYYGAVSLISVVANLLILPTLAWAMGAVFLTGVVAGVPGVETAVGWCATRILDYHIAVVGWLSEMRQFVVEIPRYQWQVFAIYGIIIVSYLLTRERRGRHGSR